MKIKTIGVPEELHRQLVNLKLELGNKNAAELIEKLVLGYRQQKFLEASKLFREKLKQKKISFSELLKKSKKIREEIADEWFPD